MKKFGRWIIVGLVALTLIALAVWAYSQTPLVPQASEVWSRGLVIGKTGIKRAVTLQPAPDGGMLLAWPNLDDQIELAHIGADGEVLLDTVLPIEAEQARDPQLRVGPDGLLHLLWREQGDPRASVRYIRLEADGTLMGQRQFLSDPASRVTDAPRLARGADGRIHALWADEVGIYWTVLDAGGGMAPDPTFLIPEGKAPLVRTDDAGRLHLVWQHRVPGRAINIYYATLDPETGELSEPEEIAEIVTSGPLQLEDVALGLGQDTVYVFWSDYNSKFDIYSLTYTSFSLDDGPRQRQTDQWQLRMSDGPTAISSLDGQQSPLPVALSERMMGEDRQVELQLALIAAGQGEMREQVITASSQASLLPVLVTDERSHLHLAWLETSGFGEYSVVYASTAPQVIENYNTLTPLDALNAAFNGIFRSSTIIVSLIGSLMMWAVVPLVGLAIYHVVTSDETLESTRSRVAVIAVLAVEVILTFALPPRIGVTTSWPALRWVAPAVAALVAAVVTVGIVRRRDDTHLFGAFFLFTILNSLLQLVLYLLF